MPKFIIRERMACWVDFYREVEAGTAEEALEIDFDLPGDELGHTVGDMLDSNGHRPEIVESLPTSYFYPFPQPNVQLPVRPQGESPGDRRDG